MLHGVHDAAYPPIPLDTWPDTPPFSDRRSRLVFIVRDLTRDAVQRALAALHPTEPEGVAEP